jgi:DNA uptake protein ComE-like DNA-binding protein
MHKLLEEFLLLSRGERRGLLTLVVLLIVAVSASFGYHIGRHGAPEHADSVAVQVRREFMASLTATPAARDTERSVARPKPSNRTAKPIVRTPIIYSAPSSAVKPSLPARPTKSMHQFKYPAGTLVDLNRADTTELKKIPGIGSTFSRRIISYRNRLGGYSSARQLSEIGLDTTQLDPWFTLSTADIRRININTATVGRLMSHPYIDFYQAQAIVDCRKANGPLHSLAPLAIYEEFPPDKLERLRPYVSFE